VVVVAMVSLMVYAMLPFRSGGRTVSNHPVTTTSVNGGPDQAKIGAEPAKSSAAKTSASASTATGKSSPSARASASSAAHSPTAPAVAQSGTGASAAVNGP
jgi:hypothetical protein